MGVPLHVGGLRRVSLGLVRVYGAAGQEAMTGHRGQACIYRGLAGACEEEVHGAITSEKTFALEPKYG